MSGIELRVLDEQDAVTETLLDIFLPWGVLALSSDRRLLFANLHAKRILRVGNGLWLLDGVLRTSRLEDLRKLDELLGQARLVSEPSEFEVIGCQQVHRSFGRTSLTVVCARLGKAKTTVGDGSVAALLLADPQENSRASRACVRQLLKAASFGAPRGRTIAEIGSELGLSLPILLNPTDKSI